MITFRNKVLKALKNVKIDPITNCWIYQGIITLGYGRIQINNQRFNTHRLSAYIYHNLDLNDWKKFACHKCDNRACCNPEHLYIGDNKSNQRDVIGETCKLGHSMTHALMHKRANGTFFRECRVCNQIRYNRRLRKAG